MKKYININEKIPLQPNHNIIMEGYNPTGEDDAGS